MITLNFNKNHLPIRYVAIDADVSRGEDEIEVAIAAINNFLSHNVRTEDIKSVKPRLASGRLVDCVVNIVTSNSPRRSSTCIILHVNYIHTDVPDESKDDIEEVVKDDTESDSVSAASRDDSF